jgi:flagellar basal-body rod protein FlgF
MDRLIYTAMTGAKQSLLRHETLSHNLANANTVGYRADTTAHRAVPIRGPGEGTRVFAIESTPGTDFSTGPMQSTGRAMDVAIGGDGFFVVQDAQGREAYTRAGNFQIDARGTVRTADGKLVVGDGGPIEIPENNRVDIARDGTISITPLTEQRTGTMIGRLKLVNPPVNELVKGGDGLFRLRSGGAAPQDEAVQLNLGVLEGSNVNVVDAMVGIIALSRQFELQMKMLSTAENDSRTAAQLLSINS